MLGYGREHPDAKGWLDNWYRITRSSSWRNITAARRTFPHADSIRVGSLRQVTVFNVRGGNHRLITAIHYNTQTVYVLLLMTHAEYTKDAWKDKL